MRPGPFADPKPKKPVEPQLPGVERLLAMGKYKQRTLSRNSENCENELIENQSEEDVSVNNKKVISNSPTKSITKMTSSNSSKVSILSNLKSVDEEYWMQELVSKLR